MAKQWRGLLYSSAWVVALSVGSVTAQPLANDLEPMRATDWTRAHAEHLLERSGFGGTPREVDRLASLTPAEAVDQVLAFQPLDEDPPFEHSGVFREGLDPFPPSRPATTALAKRDGHALGVEVKAGGNRPVQPVVNEFFYWLRASRLETDRIAYWWANRMLRSPTPLREKLALFWHGHFATNEDKVRDYRKMHQQLELFRRAGAGRFDELLRQVSKDPAMLAFLDAGINVKGSPNENFAREIMELFTMGVGHYSETDIREAARAFTGWNFVGLDYRFNEAEHDPGEKCFLGVCGALDGDDVIDHIVGQRVTAEFIATKLYRFFVRDDVSPALAERLGQVFRDHELDVRRFLATLFRSRDFYAPESIGSRIKGPVELAVSTYKKMGLREIPGIPDFNSVTGALGQRLFHPPTVAGWSEGRSWVTPGLLFDRANFVLDVVFHDIAFVAPDRMGGYQIRAVHRRLREGASISEATKPASDAIDADMMAASNLLADRDEAFNTRYGSYRGWQRATERVIPIPRAPARLDLAGIVEREELTNARAVVEHFAERFFSVELSPSAAHALQTFLIEQLGTEDVQAAASYLEDPLRELLHLMLSLPEYQLG